MELSFIIRQIQALLQNQTEITFEDQDERYDELPSIFALDDSTALVPIYRKPEYVFYKLDLTNCKAN